MQQEQSFDAAFVRQGMKLQDALSPAMHNGIVIVAVLLVSRSFLIKNNSFSQDSASVVSYAGLVSGLE
jgi:hypothetical protein